MAHSFAKTRIVGPSKPDADSARAAA